MCRGASVQFSRAQNDADRGVHMSVRINQLSGVSRRAPRFCMVSYGDHRRLDSIYTIVCSLFARVANAARASSRDERKLCEIG